MKIRNGFVSNSSSSSFVIIAPKEASDRVLERSHPYVRAVVDATMSEETFMGEKIVSYHEAYNDAYSPWEYIDIEWKGDVPSYKEIFGEEKDYNHKIYPANVFDEYYLPELEKEAGIENIFSSRSDF